MFRVIFLLPYKEKSLMFTFFLVNICIPFPRRRRKFIFYLPAFLQRAKLFNDNERIKIMLKRNEELSIMFC